MKILKWMGAASMALVLGATSANAVALNQFNRTTNDGVFTLTQFQADTLGYSTADRIAFFRPREGSGTTWNAGDTFNVTTMQNSVTSGGGSILAFLNGQNAGLGYTGDFFDDLGTTTLGAATSYFRGVAFLFNSSSGNIVFRGSSTFNGGQTAGTFDGIPQIPLPVGAWLLLGGFATWFGAGRAMRKAA